MNVYTFFNESLYNDHNLKFHKNILDLWKKSWSKNGFTPKVLSSDDIKDSSIYFSFYLDICEANSLFKYKPYSKSSAFLNLDACINISPLENEYAMSFFKWLACAEIIHKEKFIFCDYSILNISLIAESNFFKNQISSKKGLHLLNGFNTNLFISDSEKCMYFVKNMLKILQENIDNLNFDCKKRLLDHNFFDLIFNHKNKDIKNKNQSKHELEVSNNLISSFCMNKENKEKLIWFSDQSLSEFIINNPKYHHYSVLNLKYDIMNQFLKDNLIK